MITSRTLVLFPLSILLTVIPLFAVAGPGGTGGGDGLSSTPAEVELFIAPERLGKIPENLPTTLHSETARMLWHLHYVLASHRGLYFRNPRVKQIAQAIISLPQFSSREKIALSRGQSFSVVDARGTVRANHNISGLIFEPTRKACRDPLTKEKRDAHVKVIDGVIRVCLSSSRLARYNKQSFATEISSIVAHELTHAAGFPSEVDANLVQEFVLTKLHGKNYGDDAGFRSKCQVEIRLERNDRPQIFVFDDIVSYNTNFGSEAFSGRMIRMNFFDQKWFLNWSPGNVSEIYFPMVDGDGKKQIQHLKFTASTPYSAGGHAIPWAEFFGQNIVGDLELEGKRYKPEMIILSSGCAL